ncbi:MAG: uridine phosphorylase [Saprospiraceae bacterium]|jgi:uridine phosphorylase
MTRIPESELILNTDNSIYHLHLQPDQLAETIITVGDPDRVAQVSQHFDRIDTRVQNREFITHTGELGGKRISVISTGIGTDNIDIVLNELDALVNIDFDTRMIKEQLTSLKIIRIGTSGCLQKDIPMDSILLSEYAIGLDGLMHFYNFYNNADETMFQHVFLRFVDQKTGFPIRPYFAQGNKALIKKIGYDMLKGVTVTCPGFYAPQGRRLRAEVQMEGILEVLADFNHNGLRITNFEMETAAIYGLANMLGHQAVSCNALLANRANGTFSKQAKQTVDKLIELVLGRV